MATILALDTLFPKLTLCDLPVKNERIQLTDLGLTPNNASFLQSPSQSNVSKAADRSQRRTPHHHFFLYSMPSQAESLAKPSL